MDICMWIECVNKVSCCWGIELRLKLNWDLGNKWKNILFVCVLGLFFCNCYLEGIKFLRK